MTAMFGKISKAACSTLGKRGQESQYIKHFGSVEAGKKWFGEYGAFSYARRWSVWSVFRGRKFKHPGPHPAWTDEQKAICQECLIPKRDCVCADLQAIAF